MQLVLNTPRFFKRGSFFVQAFSVYRYEQEKLNCSNDCSLNNDSMPTSKTTLRTCKQGHSYYKTSDCPTCPECEKNNKPGAGFLATLASPARRALLHYNIDTVKKLADYTEVEILKLHGIGPASLPALQKALKEAGLSFKKI